jgi:hypothetical protein
VGDAVVLHDVRVVDRHVRGTLLEVADGIAAHLHQFGDEAVGPDDRAVRIIDEPRLIRIATPRQNRSRCSWLMGLICSCLTAFHPVAELTLGMRASPCWWTRRSYSGPNLPRSASLRRFCVSTKAMHHDGQRDEHTDD